MFGWLLVGCSCTLIVLLFSFIRYGMIYVCFYYMLLCVGLCVICCFVVAVWCFIYVCYDLFRFDVFRAVCMLIVVWLLRL